MEKQKIHRLSIARQKRASAPATEQSELERYNRRIEKHVAWLNAIGWTPPSHLSPEVAEKVWAALRAKPRYS